MSDNHQQEAERLAMWYCPICLHIMNECQSKHYAGCPTDKHGIVQMHLAQHTRLDLATLLAAKAELEKLKDSVVNPSFLNWMEERDAVKAELGSTNMALKASCECAEHYKKELDQLRADLSDLKTKHENLAKYARETWDKYAATQAESERLRKENEALKLQLGTQTDIAAHLEHALTTPNETVLRCLENLNRNGSVSPQLAAEALAAMKGEA